MGSKGKAKEKEKLDPLLHTTKLILVDLMTRATAR
jgi:hypothetical protein